MTKRDGTPFAELRATLAAFRRTGCRSFDQAWTAAIDRINFAAFEGGHNAEDRAATRAALAATRSEWEAAYHGEPPTLRAAGALARLAEILAHADGHLIGGETQARAWSPWDDTAVVPPPVSVERLPPDGPDYKQRFVNDRRSRAA